MRFRKSRITIITCFFLGILALTVGITSLVKRSHYIPAEATIVRVEQTYNAAEEGYHYNTIAKYIVKGKEYEGDIGFYSAGFKEGKIIEIRYDPNDPSKVEAATIGALIYFVGIGAVLTAAGVYMLLSKKEVP